MIPLSSHPGRPDGGTLLVLAALATWRVSHLLVAEDGPGDVLVKVRAALDGTPLAGVLDCFGCTSLWVGPATAAVALRRGSTVVDTLLVGAGLSGAAYLVELVRTSFAAGSGDTSDPGPWIPEPDEESDLVRVLDL